MKHEKMLEEIAIKAYKQFETDLLKLGKLSILLKDEKNRIYELYEKIYRLVNHVISLDYILYYTMILNLSSAGITEINNLCSL